MILGGVNLSSLGIIVLNFGDSRPTQNLVRSLAPYIEVGEIQICVVDNFSTEENRQNLSIFCKTIEGCSFISNDSNDGYGPGNNVGLTYVFTDLGFDLALVLNPDVQIEEGFSLRELRQISCDSECLFGGLVNQQNCLTSVFEFNPYMTISSPATESCGGGNRPVYVSGCCLGMTKSIWRITGGFSEEFFLYFEELDIIYRYYEVRGFFPEIISLKTIAVTHFEGLSTGTSPVLGEMSSFAEYWSARSRVLFYKKHLYGLILLAVARNFVKSCLLLSRGRFAQARSIWIGTYHGVKNGL